VKEDVELAEEMAHADDIVDGLFAQILRELFSIMIDQPKTVGQAMQLCFVGRYIERIADHATNIGESVVFLVKNQHKELN
jgi:phosphate transport system protein